MAERASVFESVNIGVEAVGTPGVEVDANRKMEAWSIVPSRAGAIDPFRPDGTKFISLVTVGKEHTEAKIEGILDYANLVYLLAGLVQYAGLPADNGGTPNAYTWTFVPDTDGPDTVKTYTVEKGSSVRAHQFEYGQVTGLEFSFNANDSAIGLSGDMIGNELRDGITLTTTPTLIEAVPVLPEHCAVKLAATQAGLAGAAELTRLLNLNWHYTGKYGLLNNISTEDSFVATVELPGELGGTFMVEADTTGMGFLTQARAGTLYWIDITFTGATISAGATYLIQIQMPIYLTNLGDLSDSDGVVAAEWAYQATHDVTWTKALDISVVNEVSAL